MFKQTWNNLIIIKNNPLIFLYTWLFLGVLGYLENKGYTLVNVLRQEDFPNRLLLKLIFTYIFISIALLILIICIEKAIKGFKFNNCFYIIKNYLSKGLLIVLFYMPISFITEWIYFEVNNTFSFTISFTVLCILNIFKYLAVFVVYYIIIRSNKKHEIAMVRAFLLTLSNCVVILVTIIVTIITVVLVCTILGNYLNFNEMSNFDYLSILQMYNYKNSVQKILIIYQAFISAILINSIAIGLLARGKNHES